MLKILDGLAMSIAAAPAMVFTALYLALFFAAGISLQQGSGSTYLIFLWSAAIVALHMVWLWGVYLRTRSPRGSLVLRWVFSLPLLCALFAASVIEYNRSTVGLAMFANSVGSVCFLGALWIAAGALVERQTAVRPPPIASRLGTAILMFYAPIGVWWIRPKILGTAPN